MYTTTVQGHPAVGFPASLVPVPALDQTVVLPT